MFKQCKWVSLWCVALIVLLLVQQTTRKPQLIERIVTVREPVPVPHRPPVPHRLPVPHRPVYSAVGYLQHSATNTLYPLYAQPSPTHRYRFNYHTVTNPNDSHIKLPVFHNHRDCTERFGCDELYDGNQVTVPGIDGPLSVKMYSRDFV